MKRSRGQTRWNLIIILLIAAALIYAGFKYLYPPQATEIMAITPLQLSDGPTTITGVLQKDTPVGVKGNYIIVLSDMRVVTLDVQGLDSLLGSVVSADGLLDTNSLSMTVSSITTL